mmetsp:Transcript_10712/g.35593  ORF Transcript_10712/g.35593 Transcript_10712/m.35593 type:complete len:249 (+) Transcript_10712:2601-3347(+)
MLSLSATVKLPYCGGTTACTSWYVVSSAAKPPTARLPGVGFRAKVANLIVCGAGYFVLRKSSMPATGASVFTVSAASLTASRTAEAQKRSNHPAAVASPRKTFCDSGASPSAYDGCGIGMVRGAGSEYTAGSKSFAANGVGGARIKENSASAASARSRYVTCPRCSGSDVPVTGAFGLRSRNFRASVPTLAAFAMVFLSLRILAVSAALPDSTLPHRNCSATLKIQAYWRHFLREVKLTCSTNSTAFL